MDPGTSPKAPGSPFISSHYFSSHCSLITSDWGTDNIKQREFAFTLDRLLGELVTNQSAPPFYSSCAGVLVDVMLEGKKSIWVQSEMPGAPKRLACYARSPRWRKVCMCETGDFTIRGGLLFEQGLFQNLSPACYWHMWRQNLVHQEGKQTKVAFFTVVKQLHFSIWLITGLLWINFD